MSRIARKLKKHKHPQSIVWRTGRVPKHPGYVVVIVVKPTWRVYRVDRRHVQMADSWRLGVGDAPPAVALHLMRKLDCPYLYALAAASVSSPSR